jgi:hypothetical protein
MTNALTQPRNVEPPPFQRDPNRVDGKNPHQKTRALARLDLLMLLNASTAIEGLSDDANAFWVIERSVDAVIANAHRTTGAAWKLGKTLAGTRMIHRCCSMRKLALYAI